MKEEAKGNNIELQEQSYPTGVNPQLIADGEFKDDGIMEDSDLQTKTDEHIGFVRKVLGIVATQMALTFSLALLASAHEPSGKFFKSTPVLTLSLIGYLTGVIWLFCSDTARKVVPQNYILLGVVTVSMATFIASCAANLTEASVLVAIMGCCLSTAGLFAAALFTSTRAHMIRNLSTGLAIAVAMNLIVLLMAMSMGNFHDKTVIFIVSLLMCAASGIFIIFDLLYIIIPGVADHDDYILAALNLYLDIGRMFYYLLLLFGEEKKN